MKKFKVGFIIILIMFLTLLSFNGYNYYEDNKQIDTISEEDNAVCGLGEGCEVSDKRVKGVQTGDQMPNLELIDFDGNKTNLYDLLKGKDKFILSFAADWCSDCQRQDEKLKDYYSDLPENYGAAVVFVDYTSKDGLQTTSKEQAKEFVQEQDYPFAVFWDKNNEIANLFGGIKATPTNFVLDENAIIKAKTEEIDMDILFLNNEDKIHSNIESK